MAPLPDAIETVRWLRESGRRLALLTNGAAAAQRRKIARFEIADLFDAILVEGELGFGKPDERVYLRALNALGVTPADAWMVGDNLDFDVAAPQKLGCQPSGSTYEGPVARQERGEATTSCAVGRAPLAVRDSRLNSSSKDSGGKRVVPSGLSRSASCRRHGPEPLAFSLPAA